MHTRLVTNLHAVPLLCRYTDVCVICVVYAGIPGIDWERCFRAQAIPQNAEIAKIERALGVKLPRVKKK